MEEGDGRERRAGVFVPWWAMGVAVLVLLAAAGIGIALRHGGDTIKLSGVLALDNGTSGFDDANFTSTKGACRGSGGYDDLAGGTSITVYDNSGAVISVGQLKDGFVVDAACYFAWSIAGVPKSSFYKVEISHRGQLTYSYAQARKGGLDSSIGGD